MIIVIVSEQEKSEITKNVSILLTRIKKSETVGKEKTKIMNLFKKLRNPLALQIRQN